MCLLNKPLFAKRKPKKYTNPPYSSCNACALNILVIWWQVPSCKQNNNIVKQPSCQNVKEIERTIQKQKKTTRHIDDIKTQAHIFSKGWTTFLSFSFFLFFLRIKSVRERVQGNYWFFSHKSNQKTKLKTELVQRSDFCCLN